MKAKKKKKIRLDTTPKTIYNKLLSFLARKTILPMTDISNQNSAFVTRENFREFASNLIFHSWKAKQRNETPSVWISQNFTFRVPDRLAVHRPSPGMLRHLLDDSPFFSFFFSFFCTRYHFAPPLTHRYIFFPFSSSNAIFPTHFLRVAFISFPFPRVVNLCFLFFFIFILPIHSSFLCFWRFNRQLWRKFIMDLIAVNLGFIFFTIKEILRHLISDTASN